MPTPPLPLFQTLLHRLDIPINPPTISSIPPSLLLLTIEKILGTKLPLTPAVRQCATPADELLLVKCLMGVMGDDELGMDLTAVDPVRVVMGCKAELGVIIMGLVVIAKRRGISVHPEDYGSGDTSMESLQSGRSNWEVMDVLNEEGDDDGDGDGLGEPLEPDVTLSSPIQREDRLSDVFGADGREDGHGKTMFGPSNGHGHRHLGATTTDFDEAEYDKYDRRPHDTPLARINGRYSPEPMMATIAKSNTEEEKRRMLRDIMAFDKVSNWQGSSQSTSTTTFTSVSTASSGHRTVLQEMMDEYGLG